MFLPVGDRSKIWNYSFSQTDSQKENKRLCVMRAATIMLFGLSVCNKTETSTVFYSKLCVLRPNTYLSQSCSEMGRKILIATDWFSINLLLTPRLFHLWYHRSPCWGSSLRSVILHLWLSLKKKKKKHTQKTTRMLKVFCFTLSFFDKTIMFVSTADFTLIWVLWDRLVVFCTE